ncbi:MAG: hypothetical protein E4H20_05240 [Spirochaetales bacterium]|nr:MAG: hypothetical protein E4H20_05240 [Spirochaetales bacterium]
MENRKKHILVVYEDGRNELENAAKTIKTNLAGSAVVKIRLASETSIPEILAADAYVFGVNTPGAPFWAELKRALGGMNLAGRPAAFFSAGGEALGLRKAFVASELSLPVEDAAVADGAEFSAWIDRLMKTF